VVSEERRVVTTPIPAQRQLRFGYFLLPLAADPLVATAQRVERLGLDYVGIQDHPYQRRFVDTWSLMAMIAASTATLRIFPDVANLPLRPPAVMAKAAATIDLLSGGRFELGLGAGGFWDAIAAYGGPRRSPRESLGALGEAITVIRKVWSGERNLRFEGAHYRLAGAQAGPVPAHPIGIWLGVYGPKALELTARAADGWIPSFRGDIGQIAERTRRLDDAAAAAGRPPGALRRVLNVSGAVTDGSSEGMFNGPATQWVENLAEVALSYGFDTFIFWGEGGNQLDRFAQEVVPAVREQLAQ
jgi:alkanesulfonate monooxygenase SsuD/methylene tetrahydromethanopterin reductase-like flavin-dependent oxidoreductase (luciferase family)